MGTRVLRDKTRSMATKENTIPWNAAIGIRFCIPKIPRSNLTSLLPMEIFWDLVSANIIRGGVIIKIGNKLGKIPT